MAIKLDSSPSQTVVVTCTDCPYWSAVRFGMDAAHECATNHESTLHHESHTAREAARKYRQRAKSPRR